MRFLDIFSADLKSRYKSVWFFSRILITWSLFPGTKEFTSFNVSYCPDGETEIFSWGWDKWDKLWK